MLPGGSHTIYTAHVFFFPEMDLYDMYDTDPAQHLATAETRSTIDDLDYLNNLSDRDQHPSVPRWDCSDILLPRPRL